MGLTGWKGIRQKYFPKELNINDLAVDRAQDAILMANDPGDFVQANCAATEIFGFSQAEFLTRNVFNFLPPETQGQFNIFWEGLFRYGDTEAVLEVQTAQKEEHILKVKVNGHIVPGIHLLIFTDITAPYRRDSQIKQSERKYKALVEEGAECIAILDPQGRYKYVNRSSQKIWGLKAEALTGISFLEQVHPDDRMRVEVQLDRLKETGQLRFSPYRIGDKEGAWKWMETLGTNLCHDPAVGGMVINSRDITENLLALQKLNRQIERFTLAKKATNDSIWDLDLKRHTLHWGEGYKTNFGYQRFEEQFDAEIFEQKIYRDDLEKVKSSFWTCIENPDRLIWNKKFRFYKADKSLAFVKSKAFIIRDKSGNAVRAVGALQDITLSTINRKQKDLLADVGKKMMRSGDLSSTLPSILKSIGNFLGASSAEAWIVGPTQDKIKWTSGWEKKKAGSLPSNTTHVTCLEKGKGFPGMVWKAGTPQIWDIQGPENGCLGKGVFRYASYQTAYGVPFYAENKVNAVFVFLSHHELEFFNQFQPLINQLSYQVGALIQAKVSQLQLNKFFSISPAIFCLIGMDGYFKKVNPAFTHLLASSEKEILAKPVKDLIIPEDHIKCQKIWEDLIQGITHSNVEIRFVGKKGQIFWFSWTCTPLLDEELIVMVAKDISSKKKMELKLENTILQLKSAQHLARLGYWKKYLSEEESVWSDAAYSIFGQEKSSFVPTFANLIKIFHPDDRHFLLTDYSTYFDHNEVLDYEHRIVTAEGEIRWIFQRISLKRDKDGVPFLMEGIIQDITPSKEKEQAILEQNRVLNEIAQIQSHEVRGPLSRLMGLVSLFQYEMKNNQENIEELTGYIGQSAEELDEVIGKIVRKTEKARKMVD